MALKIAHNIAQPLIICWWPHGWFLIMVEKDTAAAPAADENYANEKMNDVISSFIII